MTSKPVALLMADLGVTKTDSRPHVSNDNPFSEAHFKTLKYRPDFPQRFGCLQDARGFCGDFFGWYNQEPRTADHLTGGCAVISRTRCLTRVDRLRIAANDITMYAE